MTATIAGSSAILKVLYPKGEPEKELYNNYPALAMVKKDTAFEGESKTVAIMTESTQGASADFATAQTNVTQSAYRKFTVTRVEDFSVARVSGQALRAAKKDKGALFNLWENEMKSAMHTAMRSLAIHIFRNGTGSRGVAASGTGTATVTLGTLTDVTNFAVGMKVQATNGDGGTLRSSGATATLTAIDRAAGTLTISGNWTSSIAALVDGDHLCRHGDNNAVITGMNAWFVGGSSPATLFGLTRTVDPVRCAGQVYNATGVPMEEAVVEASARVYVEGGVPNLMFVHPRDRANLVKSIGAKVTYERTESAEAGIGFDTIALDGDAGRIKIISDMNCPRNTAYMMQWDTCELASAGAAPQILDFDSQEFLRVSNADAYEVRIGSYVQFLTYAPAWGIRITNFGA